MLSGLKLRKNEPKLIQWRNQISSVSLTYLSIIWVRLLKSCFLFKMFIHNFTIKLVEFLNFLSFTFDNFFKNYIIIIDPNIDILKCFTRKLYNFEHKLMKFEGIRPEKRLHILFICLFSIYSKNLFLLISEIFFKLFVVFYLCFKKLKKALM